MRTPALALGLILVASQALADRKAADACAAGLSADSSAIYNASVGRVGPGKENRAVVTGITQDMVSAGKLSVLSARGAAEAAGQCLKKLKN